MMALPISSRDRGLPSQYWGDPAEGGRVVRGRLASTYDSHRLYFADKPPCAQKSSARRQVGYGKANSPKPGRMFAGHAADS